MSGGTSIRRVEHHLGTAITLGCDGADAGAADAFFARIAELEAVLSRFRPDSELSRVAAGRLDLDDASPELREVVTNCERLRFLTRGDFEYEPRRRSGDRCDPPLDPNAFAKGWIVEQACLQLRLRGVRSFFVNAGGDVVAGAPSAGRSSWRVGVRSPFDPSAVLATLDLADVAVATSGAYERGAHIRCTPHGLASVTIVGPDLGTADALATAVFAAGSVTPSWWEFGGEYAVLAIDGAGRLRWTSELERHGFAFAPAAA